MTRNRIARLQKNKGAELRVNCFFYKKPNPWEIFSTRVL